MSQPIAIGYIRVSSQDQADSGLSLAAQERKIRAQAEVSGVEISEILTDSGESAKDLNRPAMRTLLGRIEARSVDCILVAKLDRLSRSVVDVHNLLADLHKARRADGGRGIDLISTAESLDTSTATGRFFIGIMTQMSQWEREVISERTSAALQEKKAQGRKTGGTAPYGYRFEGDARVEDQAEQSVLQTIKDLRAEPLSWHKVAAALNERGLLNRWGQPWKYSGLHRMAKSAGIA
ncbi:MAG: recombinase family protein [Chloroflexi bacterium]|nr:recombinase family protein [Chloroflexota bacterium]